MDKKPSPYALSHAASTFWLRKQRQVQVAASRQALAKALHALQVKATRAALASGAVASLQTEVRRVSS